MANQMGVCFLYFVNWLPYELLLIPSLLLPNLHCIFVGPSKSASTGWGCEDDFCKCRTLSFLYYIELKECRDEYCRYLRALLCSGDSVYFKAASEPIPKVQGKLGEGDFAMGATPAVHTA